MNRTRQDGVTLLELLAALSLVAVLTTALFGSFQIAFRARAGAEEALKPVRCAALALEQLRRDIVSTPPPTGIFAGAFIGSDPSDAFDDRTVLEFFSIIEDSITDGTGITKLEYVLVRAPGEDTAILVRRSTANLLATVVPDPVEEVICRRVLSMSVRFFDGDTWQETWDSTTLDNALPAAIEVSLEVPAAPSANAEKPGYVMTRILPIPSSASVNGGNASFSGIGR